MCIYVCMLFKRTKDLSKGPHQMKLEVLALSHFKSANNLVKGFSTEVGSGCGQNGKWQQLKYRMSYNNSSDLPITGSFFLEKSI